MPQPTDVTRLAGCRVLVVDDNVDAADSVALMLQALGADALAAYDGSSAIELARTKRPQVVLLDIGMPGMDGHETAAHIRAHPVEPGGDRVRLIALTGWAQPEDRHRSERAGFDMHLVKPVELDALIEALVTCGAIPPA
jgi:CheY-like chemotaxis protein